MSFHTSVSGRRPIRVGTAGVAAMPPSTLVGALQSTIGRHGERPALRSKSATFTWRQYFAQAQQFGRACIAVGHKQHEGCAIIGFNSPEWMFANVGAILAGGVAAGIYTSNTPDAAAYVVEHSNSTVVVCEGQQQLDKFLAVRDRLPHVLAYVVYEITPDATRPFVPERTLDAARAARIFSWAQFMALGGATASAGSGAEGAASADAAVAGDGEGDSLLTSPLQQELARRMAAQVPEDVLAYVYTSGTVAMPKAVMVSNDNVMFVATSVLERFAATEAERTVSYLPLSHIAAALLDIYGPIIVGFCVTFAGPDALKGSLVNSLKAVQPTIFFGVPRVFEKIQEKMLEVGARSGGCVRAISRWAKRIGAAATRAEEEERPMPWGYTAAKLLVFDNVKRALGLSQCRLLVSAAAPLQPATLAYFASLNMPVHEVYGMSECAGPATACLPGSRRSGTCGRTLPGMEIAILPIRADHVFATGMGAASVCVGTAAASRDAAAAAAVGAASPTGVSLTFTSNVGGPAGGATSPATESGAGALPAGEPAPLPPGAEGEICMRGRHVMVGYRGDEANSAQAIDAFGWLHSGDIGRLDAEGYLTITGRIKELIKTAGGENVPPVLIENTVKEELPVLSQCVVVGDRRKFLTCLLALRCRVDAAGNPTEELEGACVAELRAAGSTATRVGEAAACPAVARYINAGIARANKRAISNACALQKWRVLPRDMSVAGGELTATMKLKRSEVFKQNAALIEAMYAE